MQIKKNNTLETEIFEKKCRIKQLQNDLYERQDELKSLNDMLNKNFDHLTFRKPSISKPRLSASIETKEHLLLIFEAAAKRKQYLKKNIKSLRKIDTLNIFDNIVNLELLVKQKDKKIEDIKQELKILKKIDRTFEITIKTFENGEQHNDLFLEIMEKKMRLKNKLLFLQTNFAEKKRQDEKKMLHIQILEKKYIELKQFPPITEIREEVFNPKIQNLHLEDNSRTAKKNPYTSLKEYLKCNLIPNPTFDEQSFINLRKNLEKLKKTLLIERKSFKNVFRENNKFIEDISDEIFEMNIRLKEKEKELIMLNDRLNYFKGMNISQITLKPFITKSIILNKYLEEEFTKNYLRKLAFSSRNPLIKRIIKSCLYFTPNVIAFDDSSMFNFSNHSTITSIQIFYQDSWILGFQLKYKVLGQEEFLGLRNLKNTSQPYKIYEFILKPQDFIINIQGLSSNRIEALKFETKKGDTFTTKYGESSLKRCKGFEISYKKNWKCVFLIGGIDYFDETGIWALVYLGMEIVPIPDLNSSVLIAENDENGRNASHFITENEKIHHIRGKSAAVGYEFNKKRGF